MKISSLRLGFATNSSSSHSIVIVDKPVRSRSNEGWGFGWDEFILTHTDDKMAYLAMQVKSTLEDYVNADVAALTVSSLFGIDADKAREGYIDHQSALTLPTERDYSGHARINLEFVRDLAKFLSRKDVVVAGGNDNDPRDEDNPLVPGKRWGAADKLSDEIGNIRARKDPRNGYWTLFNQRNGTKLTFSFDDTLAPVDTHLPELVDIAITENCEHECPFCYSGAHKDGRHAKQEQIDSIRYKLSRAGVFEVALGGGDVMTHPDIVDILRKFRGSDIVPNITVRGILGMKSVMPEVLELVGGIGVSYSFEHLQTIAEGFEWLKWAHKGSLHYIMGLEDRDRFAETMTEAARLGLHVVLLGFKTVGRGKDYAMPYPRGHGGRVYDYSAWGQDILRLKRTPWLSVDTLLTQQYPEQVQMIAQSDIMYETIDGTRSMYIDAVNGTFAPSSYCEADKHIKLLPNASNLFAGWPGKVNTDAWGDPDESLKPIVANGGKE
jgi:hypothetical protein